MAGVSLDIPRGIINALPEDDDSAARDMEQAIRGWEYRIESMIESDDHTLVDVVDRLERRWEQYDDFIVELRAWGQSPIYAMAWRDLHESLLQQLVEQEAFADQLDRDQHARIVDDGIRYSDG